jgi:hypothetical protein
MGGATGKQTGDFGWPTAFAGNGNSAIEAWRQTPVSAAGQTMPLVVARLSESKPPTIGIDRD